MPALLELIKARIKAQPRTETEDIDVMHRKAVDFGVALLDERLGREQWLPRIDLPTLDLSSGFDCVLAQVHGCTYGNALYLTGQNVWLCDSVTWARDHGFCTPFFYRSLTRAWRDKIVRLRAESELVEITARAAFAEVNA